MNGVKNRPPWSEEIELTLLGPGFGESIVIHIGDNKWIIVDSCINKGVCAPLNYLQLIGVAPSNVILIVASHWHDDHVKGMSEVVRACSNAKFCCSTALSKDEFMAYVTRYSENCNLQWSSGVSELRNILEILSKRGKKHPPPMLATSNKRILQETLSHSHTCEVWTLSPSDKEIESFIKDIRNVIPIENDIQGIAPKPRNKHSVVVHINIGSEVLLLGADLEETTNNFTGWSVIVESKEKPQGKANIFKIPHHGSITGHSHEVWQHLIATDPKPYAILTPYNRGHKLPSPEDVKRICSYTNNAYSTISLNCSQKILKRPQGIEKKIAETVVGSIRPIANSIGMLRLRKNITSPLAKWDLKEFDGGCHLSKIHSP